MANEPCLLIDGLAFGEGPRWNAREQRLYFSDIADGSVNAVDMAGNLETIARIPTRPSGLGWLPDELGGFLQVVSGTDHRLLRVVGDRVEHVAELGPWCGGHANDMVMDARGGAYIGNIGFDLEGEPMEPRTTGLLYVEPDGRTRVVADEVFSPNGMAITPDGRTLIVAESGGFRLLAYDIALDGTLSNRRVYAEVPGGATPDGICLDAEGAVWLGSPTTFEFLRVREGGEVADRIPAGEPQGERRGIACMLGGPERRTLFLVSSVTLIEGATEARTSRIDVVEVDVPGAGLP